MVHKVPTIPQDKAGTSLSGGGGERRGGEEEERRKEREEESKWSWD